jgi:hypothetical protein
VEARLAAAERRVSMAQGLAVAGTVLGVLGLLAGGLAWLRRR